MPPASRRGRRRPRAAAAAPPPLGRADDLTWVEGSGVVSRLLSDEDHEEERHQRFVLDLRNGTTLLVAHNTDIATRVPLGLGDRVAFRGLFEWNPRGGMLHWTHRDPMGVEPEGFLLHRRQYYR